jgi:hypothetical protein
MYLRAYAAAIELYGIYIPAASPVWVSCRVVCRLILLNNIVSHIVASGASHDPRSRSRARRSHALTTTDPKPAGRQGHQPASPGRSSEQLLSLQDATVATAGGKHSLNSSKEKG